MGSMKFRSFIVWLAFCVFFSSSSYVVRGQNSSSDRDSLDSVVRDYALRRIGSGRARSGVLYENISLPANFSGIQVSVVRMRSSSLWLRGANFSFFDVPPRTLPSPFTRRILLVYQNLANLSSLYYRVPNYTFAAPVIGLLAYDSRFSSNSTGDNESGSIIQLKPTEDPILIRFPQFSSAPPGDTNNRVTKQCVRFHTNNGGVEFSNLTETDSCIASGGGHFSLVVATPTPTPPSSNPNRKHKSRKWRKIGIAVGILGVGLGSAFFVSLGILLYKLIRKKRIRRMETESEKNESLDSIWVGTSRMPSATVIRTQPVLENDYIP